MYGVQKSNSKSKNQKNQDPFVHHAGEHDHHQDLHKCEEFLQLKCSLKQISLNSFWILLYMSMTCVPTCCTAARLRCCCCSAAVCSMRCCCWAAYICCRYWAAAVLGCLFKACWMTWVRWDGIELLNEHEYYSASSLLSPLGHILFMVYFTPQRCKEKHFVLYNV